MYLSDFLGMPANCWLHTRNFVIIESQNITVDNIRLTAHSDDFQANPGNLGNTDGFDTLYSDDVHISV